MRQKKNAQKLRSVIFIMLVQLRLCSKMFSVSCFQACELQKACKTLKHHAFLTLSKNCVYHNDFDLN